MSMTNYLFTSESITEGHPDKVSDRISDSILDAIMAQDKRMCRKAMALYCGDFLVDLDACQLDCWTGRVRYRQLYLNAWQELAQVLLAQHREGQATKL